MTVVLTAAVYCVSFLPITVYFVAEPFADKGHEPGLFYVEFYRFVISVVLVNVLANFFVYSLTVTSFRNFLKTQFQQKVSLLSNMITPAGKVSVENFQHVLYHIARPQEYRETFKSRQYAVEISL